VCCEFIRDGQLSLEHILSNLIMSNAENYILKDGDAGLFSSDETLAVFNVDQNNSPDIDELHKLLGDAFTSEVNDPETLLNTECVPSSVEDEYEVSALGELEELFSSSTEFVDTKASLETSEQLSTEDDACGVSALDELKAYLGDSAQSDVGNIKETSVPAQEYSFESRRSVLDELQNLLQLCIDELKTDAKSSIGDTPVFNDVEYPSRDELQDLLETILSQLMLLSESSVATISTDSISVLDELKNFMHETGGADAAEASIVSTEPDSLFADDIFNIMNENETGEYEVSSISENVGSDDKGSDSIIDELNLLLGNSSSESFGSLPSSISDETPVLGELAAYMSELSDDKISTEEAGTDSTDIELASASNTLEELEAMLNEISIPGNDEISGSIKVSEDDFSYKNETGPSFTNTKEEKVKDYNELYSKAQTVEAVTGKAETDKAETDKAAVNTSAEDVILFHEKDNNNRMPTAGLLFVTVLAAGIYGFWSLLDTGDEISDRSEKSQTTFERVLEEGSGTVISAETDSIYDLLAKTETGSYTPVSSYEDGPLNIESTEVDIENKVTQKLHEENAGKKTEAEPKDLTSLQVEKFQQENRKSLNQLNKRMTEAEASIAWLQEGKTTANERDYADPVRPAPSEVPENLELPVKHKIIEQPVQEISVTKTHGKGSNIWSVHLSSYYGKPPSASELEYLGNAGISYEIKKAIVNKKVWYRVIVNKFSGYEKAKEYSDGIRKSIGRNDIWINKSQ